MPVHLPCFRRRAITDVILQEAYRIDRFRARSGKRMLFEIDPSQVGGRYPAIQVLAQGHTERLLLGKLSDYEIEPEWQTVLESATGTMDQPHVTLRRADGSREELDPDILIGADGAHSAVRKAAGLGFPGEALEASFYLADYRYPQPIDPHYVEISLFNPGMVGRIPVSRDTVRYLSTLPDFESRIEHPMSGGELVWASDFRIHFRHVERMSKGNVFLAGDAAHIHSPAGARGMNLGIEDACWLAYLISEGREQDYADLRMPAVKMVLKQTYGLTRLVTMHQSGRDRPSQFFRTAADPHSGICQAVASQRCRLRYAAAGLDRWRAIGIGKVRVSEIRLYVTTTEKKAEQILDLLSEVFGEEDFAISDHRDRREEGYLGSLDLYDAGG